MEKIVRQSLLFDFYGELLTEHQKNIYEDVVMNDMSYSEIAKVYGISRQGIYDMVKRCDKILEGYEEKLKLVEKFVVAREKIADVKACISEVRKINKEQNVDKLLHKIETSVEDVLEEF